MAAERLELRFFGREPALRLTDRLVSDCSAPSRQTGMASSGTAGSSAADASMPAMILRRAPDRSSPVRRIVVRFISFAAHVQFPKQVILEPDLARVARRDVPADRAVEKSALEKIALAPIAPARGAGPLQGARAGAPRGPIAPRARHTWRSGRRGRRRLHK